MNPFLDRHPAYPNIVIGAGFSGTTLHNIRPLLVAFMVFDLCILREGGLQ